MISHHPHESNRTSWLWAGLWAVFIYSTIPFAPALRTYVDDAVGRIWFAYLVIAVVLVGGLFAAGKLWKGIRRIQWMSMILLVSIGSVFIVWTHFTDPTATRNFFRNTLRLKMRFFVRLAYTCSAGTGTGIDWRRLRTGRQPMRTRSLHPGKI